MAVNQYIAFLNEIFVHAFGALFLQDIVNGETITFGNKYHCG